MNSLSCSPFGRMGSLVPFGPLWQLSNSLFTTRIQYLLLINDSIGLINLTRILVMIYSFWVAQQFFLQIAQYFILVYLVETRFVIFFFFAIINEYIYFKFIWFHLLKCSQHAQIFFIFDCCCFFFFLQMAIIEFRMMICFQAVLVLVISFGVKIFVKTKIMIYFLDWGISFGWMFFQRSVILPFDFALIRGIL